MVASNSGVAALAGALGLWLQQMPPLMIGNYRQRDAMTLLTLSAAAQLRLSPTGLFAAILFLQSGSAKPR